MALYDYFRHYKPLLMIVRPLVGHNLSDRHILRLAFHHRFLEVALHSHQQADNWFLVVDRYSRRHHNLFEVLLAERLHEVAH